MALFCNTDGVNIAQISLPGGDSTRRAWLGMDGVAADGALRAAPTAAAEHSAVQYDPRDPLAVLPKPQTGRKRRRGGEGCSIPSRIDGTIPSTLWSRYCAAECSGD